MPSQQTKLSWRDWLIFRPQDVNRATIRRHYERWRQERGLPTRCDIPECVFHTADLVWNGKIFKPILDHISGNRLDNRPENLRFLCPNCESQLSTRGGANKGRVSDVGDGKFTLISKGGKRDSHIFVEPGNLSSQGYAPSVLITGPASGEPTAQPGDARDPLPAGSRPAAKGR